MVINVDNILDKIIKANDIKEVDPSEYRQLAREIRRKLVRSVSRTGGHLASNLGAVELTMALHLLLDFPDDKLVWDVGHQSYVHKILTGRSGDFGTLRQLGGISGFPKVEEDPSDTFNTGHSSTSISVALGFAKARDLQGSHEKVVAVIGDGALSGGMAFEALNNAAQLNTNMMIVLNDNKMSIAPNVGGMSNYLSKIRTNQKYTHLKQNVEDALERIPNLGQPIAKRVKKAKDSVKRLFIPGMLFEDMGLIYMGPIDGHDIQKLLETFRTAMEVKDRPVLVHVLTKKGKGYRPAEARPAEFHGVGPFRVKDGEIEKENDLTYTKIFGQWMIESGKHHEELVSVCAAMPDGTGLSDFATHYPQRFFDVGIAEEHAVTFAAGMAAGGLRPVVSLYSTFMQRAYDQLIHDVCISSLPVIFTLDRSGIVGKDGETHQGIYDISYLSAMPNMTILSPMDARELVDSLNFAMAYEGGPIAIRYPRGAAYMYDNEERMPLEKGKAEVLCEGSDVLILAVGNMVEKALETKCLLQEQNKTATVVNMRFVKPWDKELVLSLAKKHDVVVTMEDHVYSGGFSQMVQAYLQGFEEVTARCVAVCWPDRFIEHGMPEELYERYGMTPNKVVEKISEEWNL